MTDMELKAYIAPTADGTGLADYYIKSEADKVIAELKDKCQMHDFFWEGCGFAKRGFKNTIAVSEAFDRLEAENAQLKKETEFMHSNCKWHAGDGCSRLLGEKLAIIDENAKLKAEIARLKGMLNVWRKVSDELPKEYEDILFIDADRCYSLGNMWIIPHYGNGPDEQYWSGRGEPRTENVTHWMPLPPAPKEDK